MSLRLPEPLTDFVGQTVDVMNDKSGNWIFDAKIISVNLADYSLVLDTQLGTLSVPAYVANFIFHAATAEAQVVLSK